MKKLILLIIYLYCYKYCFCQFNYVRTSAFNKDILTKKFKDNILLFNKFLIKDSIKIHILDINLKFLKSEVFIATPDIEKNDILDFDIYSSDTDKFLILLLKDNNFYCIKNSCQIKKYKLNCEVILNELKINSKNKIIFYNNLFNPKPNNKSSVVLEYDLIKNKHEIIFFTNKIKCNILNITDYQKFVDVSTKYIITMMPYEFSFHVTNIENKTTKWYSYKKSDANTIDTLEKISKEYHILHNYESIESAQIIDDRIVRPNACYLDEDTLYVLFKNRNDNLSHKNVIVFDINVIKFIIDKNLNINYNSEFKLGNFCIGDLNKNYQLSLSVIKNFNFPLLNPYTRIIVNKNNFFYLEKLNLDKLSPSINYIDYFKNVIESKNYYLIKKQLPE